MKFNALRSLIGAALVLASVSIPTGAHAYSPKVLRVGFVPSENLQAILKKTRPVIDALHKELNPMQVVPFVAKVIHCRGTADLRGPYVVGWQWNDDATTAESIRRFIEHMTTAETFAPGEE